MLLRKSRETGLYFNSELDSLSNLEWIHCFECLLLILSLKRMAHKSWQDVWEDLVCPCVGTKGNTNLSGSQKELLNWNCKLGVGMHKIQELIKETKAIDYNET